MSEQSLRLAVQQRIFPVYRTAFFETLASHCENGFSLFAGQPRKGEPVELQSTLTNGTLVNAANLHFFSGSYYLLWQRGLLEWLVSFNPDALIMEANPRYLSSPSALRYMHNRKKPVIGWGLGAPQSKGWRAKSWMAFLNTFDALIAYSKRGAEEYASLGFNPERIFVAPNAVTMRPTFPPPERPDNLESGKPIVLYVGRLQPRKRVDMLIRACASFAPKLQPQLWIVGDGPSRLELEALANSLLPSTRFWGAVYDQELDKYFKAADLFVLPGTGGLAVQQAMSFGLPVIVAEADGTQKDLVTADNGWIIPSGDLAALTNTLEIAINNIPKLRKMGSVSFDLVSHVNVEGMAETFLRAVRTALTDYAAEDIA